MSNAELFSQARIVKILRDMKKEKDDELKQINADLERQESLLIQSMVDEELTSFKMEGSNFILTSRLYASPKPEHKADVIEWFKGSSLADIVQETINAQTLTATVKAMQEENPLPDDLADMLNIYEKPGISIRKG